MTLRLLFLAFFTITYLPLAVPTSASGSGLEPAGGKVDMYCACFLLDLLGILSSKMMVWVENAHNDFMCSFFLNDLCLLL